MRRRHFARSDRQLKTRLAVVGMLSVVVMSAVMVFWIISALAASSKFETESGTLGAEYAIGNDGTVTYVYPTTNGAGSNPGSAARTITYNVTFPSAGTYDLYVRLWVGPGGGNDDSFFVGNGFGSKSPTTNSDWLTFNSLASIGFTNDNDIVTGEGTAGTQVWKWINLSQLGTVVSFTVSGGALTQRLQIGAREDGLFLDAFVFGTHGYQFTVADLNSGSAGNPPPPPPPPVSNLDWNDVHQRIDGFGASSAWRSNWSEAQADMFFTDKDGTAQSSSGTNFSFRGIGLSLLRSRIAPDGTSVETSIMQMAQARGAKIWSTPWTPPAYMKDSASQNGGHFLSNAATNQLYANQLADYVLSMKTAYGIDLYAISVQNEPDISTTYESCLWTAQQIHDFVPYLHDALATRGFSTNILLPEKSGWDFNLAATTMNDPATAAQAGILADHDYGAPAGPVNNFGKPLWETECSLLGGSDSSIGNGIYWAKRIHTFMASVEANAWHYWWLVSGGTGNEGLCDSNWIPAKRMYTLGNFSRFVRPGYYRIGSSDNAPTAVLTSAYKDSTSGKFAIVAINQYDGTLHATFNLNNFPSVSSVVPWITSETLSLADQTVIAITNSSFTYDLPPMSVVTFVGQIADVNEAPVDISLSNTTVAENQPAGTTVGSFSTTDPNGDSSFTYQLVSGPGSDDNSSFSINSNSLQTAASFDYETRSSYRIRVRSTDPGGLPVEKSFTITVTNVLDTNVDFGLNAQRIDGFGIAEPWRASVIHGALGLTPEHQREVLDLFFSRELGAGISILRLGVETDSSIQPNDPGGPSATPQYVWDGQDGGQVWLAKEAQGYDVRRFLAAPWSGPPYMKTNNSTSNGGTLCGLPGTICDGSVRTDQGPTATSIGDDWRQAYANFLVQWIKFYQQEGIQVTDLSMQNEPNFTASYASMRFTPAQAVDFIKVLKPTMQAAGLPVSLACCDATGWSPQASYTSAIEADTQAKQLVDTHSGHQYGSPARTPLQTNKTVWMTEWGLDGTTWNPAWDGGGSSASSDAIVLANDISDTLTLANVNAYVYWYGASLGATRGFIQIDNPGPDYHVSKRLWAMAAFSRYVRPGSYRVQATISGSNLKISAFRNADGTRVINIINNGTAAGHRDLTIDSATAGSGFTVTSYLTDETHSLSEAAVAQLNSGILSVDLAPRSLTTIVLSMDVTPPVSLASSDHVPNAAGWNNTNVAVTIHADDGTGSGVKSITYSATGVQTIPSTTVNGSMANISMSSEGTTTVSYYATDNAGNVESTKTLSINIDRTPPRLTFGNAVPTANANGWNNTNVSVPFTTSDDLSGVDITTPNASPLVLASEGTAVTGTVTVTDKAGNCATFTSSAFKIDKTAPVITINAPGDGTSYLLNALVAANFNCADNLSGVSSCTGPVSSDANFDTATVGNHQFNVNTVDQAGNSSSKVILYSVQYVFGGFINLLPMPAQNTAQAGSTVIVRYQIKDANGAYVSNLASFVSLLSYPAACLTGVPFGEAEQLSASGNTTLRYDSLTNQFVFNWKTDRSWTNSCRLLELTLADGTRHDALMQFR